MAVDSDKRLGPVHFSRTHLILRPPVNDFVASFPPKKQLPLLRKMHGGDFRVFSSLLCTELWREDAASALTHIDAASSMP